MSFSVFTLKPCNDLYVFQQSGEKWVSAKSGV